jgi:hypothetical protein
MTTNPVDPFAQALDERIRAAVEARVEALQRPLLVSQRSVAAVVGLPPGAYLEAARRGDFPSHKAQRLVMAKTGDVVAYVERHPHPARSAAANDAEPGASSESRTLARAGFRRVG